MHDPGVGKGLWGGAALPSDSGLAPGSWAGLGGGLQATGPWSGK